MSVSSPTCSQDHEMLTPTQNAYMHKHDDDDSVAAATAATDTGGDDDTSPEPRRSLVGLARPATATAMPGAAAAPPFAMSRAVPCATASTAATAIAHVGLHARSTRFTLCSNFRRPRSVGDADVTSAHTSTRAPHDAAAVVAVTAAATATASDDANGAMHHRDGNDSATDVSPRRKVAKVGDDDDDDDDDKHGSVEGTLHAREHVHGVVVVDSRNNSSSSNGSDSVVIATAATTTTTASPATAATTTSGSDDGSAPPPFSSAAALLKASAREQRRQHHRFAAPRRAATVTPTTTTTTTTGSDDGSSRSRSTDTTTTTATTTMTTATTTTTMSGSTHVCSSSSSSSIGSHSRNRSSNDDDTATVSPQRPSCLDSEPSMAATTTATTAAATRSTATATMSTATRLAMAADGGNMTTPAVAASAAVAQLSAEQYCAYHCAVKQRRSLFITGGAGTGKSHLLRAIIAALPSSTTFVTATTGLAALQLGGTTLHSFAGCGLVASDAVPRKVLHQVAARDRTVRTWRRCRVLVIDEVSMLDGWFFDLLDYIARNVRSCPRDAFGGIQLILSGDFLQLPPVQAARQQQQQQQQGSLPNAFCFESEAWLRLNPLVCCLSQPYRQRDRTFFALLNEMRFGHASARSLALLHTLCCYNNNDNNNSGGARRGSHGDGEQGSTFTLLRATRAEVERENALRYARLTSPEYMYHGKHTGRGAFPSQHIPEVVRLREGCRVMLVKNIDAQLGLVNGSSGTVVGFIDFVKGGYVFRSGGGGSGGGGTIDMRSVRAVCRGRAGDATALHTCLPLVRFDLRRGDGVVVTREVVIEPQEWKELQGAELVSCSVQVPLILAYAITIHKSQGMTLGHVDIDFTHIFEAGQAYVALSRCTDLNTLRVRGFAARVLTTSPSALAYYQALDACRRDDAARRRQQQQQQQQQQHKKEQGDADVKENDAVHADKRDDDGDMARLLQTLAPYGYEHDDSNNNNNDEAAYQSNASARLEERRRRRVQLVALDAELRRVVLTRVQSLERVRGALLVMDASALLSLLTTSNTRAQYEAVFLGEHGNAMRVSRAVMDYLLSLATPRCRSGSSTAMTTTPCSDDGDNKMPPATTTAAVAGSALDVAGRASASRSPAGAVPGIVDVAAEALRLVARARADFVADLQRDGQATTPLPPPLPAWRRFAAVLPLLQSHTDTTAQRDYGYGSVSSGNIDDNNNNDDDDNDDARERLRQASVLQYALFLRQAYQANVAVCTDDVVLAAHAVALDLKVVSAQYLQSA